MSIWEVRIKNSLWMKIKHRKVRKSKCSELCDKLILEDKACNWKCPKAFLIAMEILINVREFHLGISVNQLLSWWNIV